MDAYEIMVGLVVDANSIALIRWIGLVVCAVFKSCTALRPYIAHLDDIYKDFNNYKFRVPVSGAIILDDTYERVIY